MYRVLVAEIISDKGLEILYNEPDINVNVFLGLSQDGIRSCIEKYDAIIIRSKTKITSEIITIGTNLKIIGRAGIGLENIDIPAARTAGIIVISAPFGSTISVAEHTIGMMLAMARHIPQAYESMRAHKWDRDKFMGIEMHNKMLGIIGFGNIGLEVAKRARAFGMEILAYDPYCTLEKAGDLGTLVTLEELLENSDFLSVHVPKTDETIGLIGTQEFKRCKPGIKIVNTARGGIINEKALLQAIKDGIVAGCALDVFENEPHVDKELLKLPQIVATPHLGASTEDAQVRVAIAIAEDVVRELRNLKALQRAIA